MYEMCTPCGAQAGRDMQILPFVFLLAVFMGVESTLSLASIDQLSLLWSLPFEVWKCLNQNPNFSQ